MMVIPVSPVPIFPVLKPFSELHSAQKWDRLKASHAELLAACEATVLLHRGGIWTIGNSDAWVKLTNNPAVTTRALCDFVRAAIANAKKLQV